MWRLLEETIKCPGMNCNLQSHLTSEVSKRRRRVAAAHWSEQLLAGEGGAAASQGRGLAAAEGRTRSVKRRSKTAKFSSLESAAPVTDSLENGNVIPGMEEWYQLQTPPAVVRALSELGFRTPTEIQRRAIPPAIGERCNVIGAAETVSRLVGSQAVLGC